MNDGCDQEVTASNESQVELQINRQAKEVNRQSDLVRQIRDRLVDVLVSEPTPTEPDEVQDEDALVATAARIRTNTDTMKENRDLLQSVLDRIEL